MLGVAEMPLKLTQKEKDARLKKMLEMRMSGATNIEIAAKFGINRVYVSLLLKGHPAPEDKPGLSMRFRFKESEQKLLEEARILASKVAGRELTKTDTVKLAIQSLMAEMRKKLK